MAIIADDDKLQQDPNQQAQQQGAPGISAGGPTTVSGGQSSADVGSPVSTAGVGAGGTGGWTNLQAYIEANKGDTGSAQALDKTVSGQFDAEKNAYTQDSSKFLGDAKQKVDANKIDNSQADNLIKQAGANYNYDSSKSGAPAYGDAVSKVRGALTNAYSGPREYNYAIGNQAAQYGADLKDNQGFDGLMKHIYQQAAPGGLNSGQTELQKQLDVNNSGLVDKRKELQGKYSDLTAGRDKTVADTTAGLSGLEQQYRTNQNGLQDYLTKQSNVNDTSVKQQEADARAEYFRTLNDDKSGHNNSFLGALPNTEDPNNAFQSRDTWGTGGTNLTWKQLENEQQLGAGDTDAYYNVLAHPGKYHSILDQTMNPVAYTNYANNGSALNQFYAGQDAKYANTGDTEERNFNALQDFLNTGAAKKEQGFKVRG